MDGAALIPEFEHEAALTRRMLARVPFERGDWKPHEKSSAILPLAEHLADLPGWVPMTIDQDSLNMAPGYRARTFDTVEGLLEHFDRTVVEAKAALERASAEDLQKEWALTQGDTVLFSASKATVLRSFVLSHSVHHRAQLGVYLRLLDLPVPSTYGPSADEYE